MNYTSRESEVEVLTFMSQSELARYLESSGKKVSRQAVSKRLKNPEHRKKIRFDDSGRVCLQDYLNLPKLSPGRKAKANASNTEQA